MMMNGIHSLLDKKRRHFGGGGGGGAVCWLVLSGLHVYDQPRRDVQILSFVADVSIVSPGSA